MRFPLIRSVLRTAIAVGVISSYQSSSLASCWNELLRPNAGVCYIYDLQSDEFAGSSLSKQEVRLPQPSNPSLMPINHATDLTSVHRNPMVSTLRSQPSSQSILQEPIGTIVLRPRSDMKCVPISTQLGLKLILKHPAS